MNPASRRSCDTLFPAAMSNGGYRTDSVIGIAEKFNWESTLRSPGRNREADVRSTWDARRQLEGLEERTASAVAYLHRQLLDLQAEQSPKIASDVGVRLDALEQKQQQTAHRLDAMADVANSCSKEQDAQEQRLQALQERAINAEAASQRVAGLLQELRRDVTEIFEDGRLSPRSLGGEELRSLVAEQRLSQLEVAVWSLQSMELPEVQLAVHAQDRRLADLETGPHGQDVLQACCVAHTSSIVFRLILRQARHAPDFIVEAKCQLGVVRTYGLNLAREEGGHTDEGTGGMLRNLSAVIVPREAVRVSLLRSPAYPNCMLFKKPFWQLLNEGASPVDG
ncbi:unnamed protein product [Symbiodinium sp. CCMP2592]|nr:unnamed protein product [Symbiodinium sp. CCMP2592]